MGFGFLTVCIFILIGVGILRVVVPRLRPKPLPPGTCTHCRGTGRRHQYDPNNRKDIYGRQVNPNGDPCPACKGSGRAMVS
jgi:hypothetical protein